MKTLPELLEELPELAARHAAGDHVALEGEFTHYRPSARTPSLTSVDLAQTLVYWCGLVACLPGAASLPGASVGERCKYLLAAYERFGEAVGLWEACQKDLGRVYRALAASIGLCRPNPLRCLTVGCDAPMVMINHYLECANGHRHEGVRKYRYHSPVTLYEASQMLGIPYDLVKKWRWRGRLPAHYRDPRDRRVWVYPWDVLRVYRPDLTGLIDDAFDNSGVACG